MDRCLYACLLVYVPGKMAYFIFWEISGLSNVKKMFTFEEIENFS
jgi:hypothetical protein